MSAYSVIAKVYDLFQDEFDYKRYAQLIKKYIEEYNLSGGIVDAGCGTGVMLSLLNDLPNDLIGIDISNDMLVVASEKNTKALLLKQDIKKMDLVGKVSLVYSSLDVINHLKSLKEIGRFFRGVYTSLEKDGLFIFDFNLPYKHEQILHNNVYILEKPNNLLVWQNFYTDKKIRIVLTLFSKESDRLYRREDEEFFEYTYLAEEITSLLENNFNIIEVIDGESFSKLSCTSQRALIIAKRK